jgi:hypothetical protein
VAAPVPTGQAEELTQLAKRFSASRFVVLRRLLTAGRTTPAFYRAKHDEWTTVLREMKENGPPERPASVVCSRSSSGGIRWLYTVSVMTASLRFMRLARLLRKIEHGQNRCDLALIIALRNDSIITPIHMMSHPSSKRLFRRDQEWYAMNPNDAYGSKLKMRPTNQFTIVRDIAANSE